MLISQEYRDLNAQLHRDNPSFGNDNFGWSQYALTLVNGNGYKTVLDYGCGKGKLKVTLEGFPCEVREYDPAIEGKDGPPEAAELVVCCDVLEHIEPVHLNAVLRHLRDLAQRRLFATICCRPAGKTLADGRNAHLIVKPNEWWRSKMGDYFQILAWENRGATVACELGPKDYIGRKKVRSRRPFTTEMAGVLGNIRHQVNAHSDAFSQIKSVAMWEGVDDAPADLQGACDLIEDLDDIDEALREVAQKSLKCTFIAAKITPNISEWDWRRMLDRRFRVAVWEVAHGRVFMTGAPGVMVQGICAVGAVTDDDRWVNVGAAIKRYSARIEPAEPHGRVALLACYGPSLKDTIGTIQAAAGEVDVVSVSGSHDFLLENGVVPKYHVECDPRPHKALNVDKSHPDVTYLIASVCHPEYFDKLGDAAVRLWHVSTSEHVLRLINECGENPKHIISGGGSVGLRAIPLLYAMGYREIHIHAMDCSFKSEGEGIAQWAGKHAGKKQDCCEVLCDGELFISSPVLLTYATGFFESIQKVTDLSIRLYGKGLLQSMCEYYMRQGAECIVGHVSAEKEEVAQNEVG